MQPVKMDIITLSYFKPLVFTQVKKSNFCWFLQMASYLEAMPTVGEVLVQNYLQRCQSTDLGVLPGVVKVLAQY